MKTLAAMLYINEYYTWEVVPAAERLTNQGGTARRVRAHHPQAAVAARDETSHLCQNSFLGFAVAVRACLGNSRLSCLVQIHTPQEKSSGNFDELVPTMRL